MNRLIENLKGKLKFGFNGRGLFENNAIIILLIFFVATLTLPQIAFSQPADNSAWDKPFGSPQYLLHATGHGTMDGSRTDDWWFLNPNQPTNGFIALPDGEGGTFTYSIDQSMGPFNTPREVCAAAGGKTKDNSVGGFNCKDMASQPENTNKPDQPNQTEGGPCANACDRSKHLVWDGFAGCSCICENGWKFDEHGNCEPSEISDFESELELDLEPQGTTQTVNVGDKAQLSLSSGNKAEIKAKCQKLDATWALLALVYKDDLLHYSNVEEMGIGFYVTTLWVAMKNLKCDELLREDSAKSSKTYVGNVAGSDGVPTGQTGSGTGAVEMEIGLQQGPLHAEVVNDQVSLNVETPTVIVGSEGRNDFGVAYDPNTGKSLVAAYQNPLLIKPSNGNQAPFTLGSGQAVEVSSSGIGQITGIGQTTGGSTYISPNGKDMYGTVGGNQRGCHTDPSTGVVTCVDTIGDFSNPEGSNQGSSDQGGCYKDPKTGVITCVDSNGNPINTNPGGSTRVGSGTNKPESQDLQWVGMDADKVGIYDNGNPNGVHDGHFVLNLNLPAPTEIKSIQVYSADANGNPKNGQFWDTAAINYYIIGVFNHGTQLNMHHVPTLGMFSGPTRLDLYCDDSGWFKPGNWFGLQVTFGDGTKLERLISI